MMFVWVFGSLEYEIQRIFQEVFVEEVNFESDKDKGRKNKGNKYSSERREMYWINKAQINGAVLLWTYD